jgi:hypothetical protein
MVCCWGCLSALQVAEMLAWMARKRGVRFFRRAATSTQMHARVHAVQTSLRMHKETAATLVSYILPLFRNIRCFSFVK